MKGRLGKALSVNRRVPGRNVGGIRPILIFKIAYSEIARIHIAGRRFEIPRFMLA
jgi:hypothetical protein